MRHKQVMVGPVNNSAGIQKSTKRKIIIALVCIAVAALVYGAYVKRDTLYPGSNQCSGKSQSQLMTGVVQDVTYQRIPNLKKDVATIQKIKNYDRDPVCLYPMVQYYVLIGDAKSAQASYDKLAKVTDEKKITKVYGKGASSLNTQKIYVDSLTKQNSDFDKNNKAFGFTK